MYKLGSSNDLLDCCAAGLEIGGWGSTDVGLDGIEGLMINGADEGKGGALDGTEDLLFNGKDEGGGGGGGGGGTAGELDPFPNALRAACIANDGGFSWKMEALLDSGGGGVDRLGGVREAGIGGGGGALGGDGATNGGGRRVVGGSREIGSGGRGVMDGVGGGTAGRLGAVKFGGGGAATEGFLDVMGGGGGFDVPGRGGGGALGGVISEDKLLDLGGISELGRRTGLSGGLRKLEIIAFGSCEGDDSVVWGIGLRPLGRGAFGGLGAEEKGGFGIEAREVSGSER